MYHFMNQCVVWLHAEFMHSFDLQVFTTSCLSHFAIFLLKWWMWRRSRFALNSASNLAWMQQKLIKYFNKHLVMTLGHTQSYDCFNEHQLTMTDIWTNLNQQNTRKCWVSAWGYPQEPQTNDPSCMQHYGTVIRDMPANFVRQTQHEADCYKVRAKK